MPRRNGAGIALLADPLRREIIALVATRPRRPSSVAKALGVSPSTATRQLRLLEKAGLLVRRRLAGDGRGVLYFLDARQTGPIVAWLAGTEVGLSLHGDD